VVETDAVARFKAFVTKELLAQLHAVPGSAPPKQAAYEGVRNAYTAEFGWPAEFDEVEPGAERTPRWLNRLHWAVADLVQAGVLEKSGSSDDLRATEMGKGLIVLAAPFGDTPQTRELLAVVAAARTDPADNAAAADALAKFQARFPADRLAGMSPQDYAIGGGDQDNFSWWLERALPRWGATPPVPRAATSSIARRMAATISRPNWPHSPRNRPWPRSRAGTPGCSNWVGSACAPPPVLGGDAARHLPPAAGEGGVPRRRSCRSPRSDGRTSGCGTGGTQDAAPPLLHSDPSRSTS
jgi:hypothetical protein